jgi:hypothetical protein
VRVEPLHIGQRPHRLVGDRATRLLQGKRQAHRNGQGRDVVEQDDRIDAEAARAECRPRGQLDLLGELEKAQPRPQLAELRVPPTRLTHRPDRRAFDCLTPGSADKQMGGSGFGHQSASFSKTM